MLILRLPRTPPLDLDAPLTGEWREGALWYVVREPPGEEPPSRQIAITGRATHRVAPTAGPNNTVR